MNRISEKLARQERIRGYLLQDMSHKEIMKKESVSQPTLWRDITQIGKKDNKPMKRPAFVFATRSFMWRAKRKRMLKSIHELEDMLASNDVETKLKIEAEITKKERALEVVDNNFDDWTFRSGVIKEVPTEQKVKVSFSDFKKLKEGGEEVGQDKNKVQPPSVPKKISLEFS